MKMHKSHIAAVALVAFAPIANPQTASSQAASLQVASRSRIDVVRISRFRAGRDLDKEATGLHAEGMGQRQEKLFRLPEAIWGSTS